MDELANKLSEYIDSLNAEQEPDKQRESNGNPELEKGLAAIRQIRSLREPAMPDSDYPAKLAQVVTERLAADNAGSRQAENINLKNSRSKSSRLRLILTPVAAIAAGLLLFFLFSRGPGMFGSNIVYAMDKAVSQLSNYHGVLEITTQNAAGEEWLVRRAEIWSEGDKYAVQQNDGSLTVNNGERKWQIRPQEHKVALLPLVPDPVKSGFDLRDEAQHAMQYPYAVVGEEPVAGRSAKKIEISPPGGSAYYLWVDTQTNLPVQLQMAMQNALQTTYTFTSLETNIEIDPNLFAYEPPAGYQIADVNPGQLVAAAGEASAISGFAPLLPQMAPNRILAWPDRIIMDYGDTTVAEKLVAGNWAIIPGAALGTAAGSPLEVSTDKLRWRQNGLEIEVEGARRIEIARQIAADLTLPDPADGLAAQGQVAVPVDLEIVRADQKQVDAGHTPWQLDPLQVSLTFVNLQVSPQGIVGEPQIGESSFQLAANNGAEAVVTVNKGPVKQVYLKRLIRQDESGIWSVVAYDPR
ncbi:MAG: sigma-E factor regulatory protein RseB domain-containing protein [Syntrophomonadaceae bacterium]|nr:sigma-E factor regulatory protein RseB domain-containing protein [Syntrophomonadaceae bacterium]